MKTILKNCATEPDKRFDNFLNKLGGNIKLFKRTILIQPNKINITKVKHKIIPDRIEAGPICCWSIVGKKLAIKKLI